MKNKINGVYGSTLLGVFVGGLAHPALAVSDFSFTAGAGLESHSNAALVSGNEESDTRRLINADVGYLKDDGALNINLGYSAEYADYAHDTQSDETAISGKTAVRWLIAPRQLEAVLYHQISQQLTDRRGADVASNREERSIITAGVDGFLHFSSVDALVLSPRFTDVHLQESDNQDSQRASMTTTWNHRISQVSSLDLSASYDHVTFDDGENDYNSPGVLLSFRTALARLSWELGVGANRVNRDTGEDVTGSTVRASIDYNGEDGSHWGASYVRQLTDTSMGLADSELTIPSFQSNDSNFTQFDIIHEDKADVYWRGRVSASNEISLGAGYQRQDYKDTPQDQDVAYAELGYQYSINSRWSAGIDGRYEHTKFLDDPQQKYDTTRLYLNVSYRPTRPLEIRLSVGQDKRNADVSTSDYTDNVAMIRVNYRFF